MYPVLNVLSCFSVTTIPFVNHTLASQDLLCFPYKTNPLREVLHLVEFKKCIDIAISDTSPVRMMAWCGE